MRNDIFPATNSKEKNKYFAYIPIMFSTHSIITGVYAPPHFIWMISVISMFIFLMDEYMESKVALFDPAECKHFRQGVQNMFDISKI